MRSSSRSRSTAASRRAPARRKWITGPEARTRVQAAARRSTTRWWSASAPCSPTIRGSRCATCPGGARCAWSSTASSALPADEPARADRARDADLRPDHARRAATRSAKRSRTPACAVVRVPPTAEGRCDVARRAARARRARGASACCARAAPSSPAACSPAASPTSCTSSSRRSCSARAVARAPSTGPAPRPRGRAAHRPAALGALRQRRLRLGPLGLPEEREADHGAGLTPAEIAGSAGRVLSSCSHGHSRNPRVPRPAPARGRKPVAEPSRDEIQTLIDDMAETMYAAPGVRSGGDADRRRTSASSSSTSRARTSRAICASSSTRRSSSRTAQTWTEGCLSFPGVTEEIKRAEQRQGARPRPRRQAPSSSRPTACSPSPSSTRPIT